MDVGEMNGDSCRIWTRRFGPPAANGAKVPLVMIHGMGAGLALFALNYDELAKDRTVYAIDLPGEPCKERRAKKSRTCAKCA